MPDISRYFLGRGFKGPWFAKEFDHKHTYNKPYETTHSFLFIFIVSAYSPLLS